MKKNDTLKKHHFWILLGLVPLFVLIAVLVVTSSVGAEIDKKAAEIKTAEDSLKGKNPKSDKLLGVLDILTEKVKKKKTSLWEQNWERQAPIYTWPKFNPQLQAVEKANLTFGEKIPEENFTRDQFKLPEVYLAEYSNENKALKQPATRGMALSVAPTEFRGGWDRVLRHVTKTGWGPGAPSSEQIWLLMEDIWVQRSLLDAVRSVNTQFGAFTRVEFKPDGKTVVDDPRRRRFESRTWAVELEVKEKDSKTVLTGRLINLTNRLQLMGMNNTMILKVWLTKGKEVRPFEFKIGSEFLPGVGALKPDGKTPANVLDIVPTEDHIIPPSLAVGGVNTIEIDRVEQVFDTRTVPVRRIEALALGFTDSRHAGSQLVMPRVTDVLFKGFKEGETTGGNTTGLPAGMGDSSIVPPGGMGMTGLDGRTPGGSDASTDSTLSGGGTLETRIDANRKRYIQVTDQVRRMPVAIAVIVDQAHMQEVLLAFANSPLRFQITQVTWKRFRDKLGGTSTGFGTGSTSDPDVELSGRGDIGALGPPPGMGGIGIGPRPMPGGTDILPPGSPLGPPGGMGIMNPYSPASGTVTTVSESQLTSGLVELSVYGIVSLYEKYSPEVEAADAEKEKEAREKEAREKEAKDKEAKDKAQKDGDPKKGADPMPKEAVTPDPKTGKMRRRVRKS